MPKGKKYGGRKKGTPNKVTGKARMIAQNLVDDNKDKFEAEMEKLSGKDYCEVYLKLLAFVAPKLKAVDLTTGGGKKIKFPNPKIAFHSEAKSLKKE